MGTKQLRDIYGGNSRQAMARAIRTEIDGGDEILKAEQRVQMRMDHLPLACDPRDLQRVREAYNHAHSRRVEAENAIRAKYGMPLRGDSTALPQR